MMVWTTGSTRLSAISTGILVLVLAGCGTVASSARPVSLSALDAHAPSLEAEPAKPAAPAVNAGEPRGPAPIDRPHAVNDAALPTTEMLATPDATRSEAASQFEAATSSEFRELDLGPETRTAALALAAPPKTGNEDVEEEEPYDPWESFNEKTFEFNVKLDRHVLKPVAKAYDRVMPDELQRMIENGFDNLNAVPRIVNSALQGKWLGAMREVGRFLINSTVGIAGLWDMAKQEWGIEKSNEDFGQTLGVWGVGPGPYLVLPFLDPMTVRDGIGRAVDSAMDPLSYVLPFVPERLAMKAGSIVNERSLNLELFQGFEETVVDLYSAVRHAYLERRKNLIKQ